MASPKFWLDHISLLVSEIRRSLTFYTEVLGLPEIENKAERSHVRWVGLGDGRAIHLVQREHSPPGDRPINTHFALSSPDLDSVMERLASKGVPFGNLDGPNRKVTVRADGVRAVYLQDPDGHWLEINDAS
jgi:lactoylglutathione lyase